ncbi:MAG: type II toxin-antitoxin system VapC family toxin [Verrucomicrobiae bacterium]|nr:type II toxin-antitoxin system VapC family toxin [Verrucomicrobiae bacterium]
MKLLIRESDSEFYGRLTDGQPVSSSMLAHTEVWAALMAKERGEAIAPDLRRRAWQRFERYCLEEVVDLASITDAIGRRANWIIERVHPRVPLRSLDALHLATADQLQDWPLVTSDRRMRDAAALMGYPLSDPCPPPSGTGVS